MLADERAWHQAGRRFRLEPGFTDFQNLRRLRDRVQLTRHLPSRLGLPYLFQQRR